MGSAANAGASTVRRCRDFPVVLAGRADHGMRAQVDGSVVIPSSWTPTSRRRLQQRDLVERFQRGRQIAGQSPGYLPQRRCRSRMRRRTAWLPAPSRTSYRQRGLLHPPYEPSTPLHWFELLDDLLKDVAVELVEIFTRQKGVTASPSGVTMPQRPAVTHNEMAIVFPQYFAPLPVRRTSPRAIPHRAAKTPTAPCSNHQPEQ